MHDGAGTDEGDTYKYECEMCRTTLPDLTGLIEHLREDNEKHVVCQGCLRAFDDGALSREEQEGELVEHLKKVIYP